MQDKFPAQKMSKIYSNQGSVLNGPIKIIKKILVIIFLSNSDQLFYLLKHCIGRYRKTLTWTGAMSLTRLQIYVLLILCLQSISFILVISCLSVYLPRQFYQIKEFTCNLNSHKFDVNDLRYFITFAFVNLIC